MEHFMYRIIGKSFRSGPLRFLVDRSRSLWLKWLVYILSEIMSTSAPLSILKLKLKVLSKQISMDRSLLLLLALWISPRKGLFSLELDGSSFWALASCLKMPVLSTIITGTVCMRLGKTVACDRNNTFRRMFWLTFMCRSTCLSPVSPDLIRFVVWFLHLIHCLSVSFILHSFYTNSCRFIWTSNLNAFFQSQSLFT